MTIPAHKDQLSKMAENLIGSEIIKLAAEVNEKIKNGEKIYNFTIGDFNPNIFPIPAELKEMIHDAYDENETNYPPADGMPALKESVAMIRSSSLCSLSSSASWLPMRPVDR